MMVWPGGEQRSCYWEGTQERRRDEVRLCEPGLDGPGGMFSDFLAPGGGWTGVGAGRFRASLRAEHRASACLNYLILSWFESLRFIHSVLL